ncbi:sigma-70 family RNA polymerase sigma factor [Phormidesmis priestleyi ULC007]|uniref:Sigma-70 family RNA polymerase sigma factor n=1 Tax=Phormidesmis priestleyi ULC007 TaxID=1920490 RepID=A0A2T1DBU2_9CYAN|nr:sigma-70 family RNA polymerase sigma factor [Phormidesmis priestleyi]PSB17927.1 sigma-70 family RNA polymerase sigma factor [Phormidesmis priestleyi ULC007]PZO53904.1 MAG: sigma-70 family RNA polymerase sigma factor [Phormidesmis priestleyi]
MRSRQSLLEIFSTFLQFEGDRVSVWAIDARLRRSMQQCLQQSDNSETSGNFWALYWYKVWQEDEGNDPNSFAHLIAYLQETCYWSAQKTMTNFALTQYTLPDCFQVAISKVQKILSGFNPQQGFSLQNYASAIFASTIRDTLRQRQEVDICTNWALLRKVSQKRLIESLQNAGLSAETIATYILAWNCFKSLYVPTQETATRKLPRPDEATWAVIEQRYNADRRQVPSAPAAQPETLEKWLNVCAQAARSYLNPNLVSINTPKAGQDTGELLDDVPESSRESLLADLIADEEDQTRQDQRSQLNQILEAAIGQLDPELQAILHLYYRENCTQQQMAERLDIKQYTVSRRLTKAREQLLKKLALWSQETLHISLTSALLQSMSLVMEEWLQQHYKPSSSV